MQTEKDTAMLAKLREPLPPEAIKPHPTKNYLSQINAIYVVERLNNVFGLAGWRIKNEIIEKIEAGPRYFQQAASKGGGTKEEYHQANIIIKSVFTAKSWDGQDIYLEAFGGNDNDDLGDAYKGACTDALTKIGSYLGIGQDIWKDKKGAAAKPQPAYNRPLNQDTPVPSADQIEWIQPGTDLWGKTVIAMAREIHNNGGKFEDLITILRTQSKKGFNRKHLPELEKQIQQTIQKGQKS
jgi:hypothetical protein